MYTPHESLKLRSTLLIERELKLEKHCHKIYEFIGFNIFKYLRFDRKNVQFLGFTGKFNERNLMIPFDFLYLYDLKIVNK